MRNVVFKKWIPVQYKPTDKNYPFPTEERVPNTGCWEQGCSGKGLFHQWANKSIYDATSIINAIVAIVELEDGSIEEIQTDCIRFIDKP